MQSNKPHALWIFDAFCDFFLLFRAAGTLSSLGLLLYKLRTDCFAPCPSTNAPPSLPFPRLVSFRICNFFPCLSELVSLHCRRYAPSCLANDQQTHAKAKKPHASPARQHLLVHCSSAWLCISVEHIHGFHVITMLVLFTLEAPATTIKPAFPLQHLPGTAMFVLVQMWGQYTYTAAHLPVWSWFMRAQAWFLPHLVQTMTRHARDHLFIWGMGHGERAQNGCVHTHQINWTLGLNVIWSRPLWVAWKCPKSQLNMRICVQFLT